MDGFTVGKSNRFVDTGSFKSIEGTSIVPSSPSSSTSSTEKTFAQTLKDAVSEVNSLQKAQDKGMQDLATGRTDNVADVMIAAEKADIALRVMVQVRNKVIDAYSEMMRMQV
ncbi:MAG: flagellar hook-basal body complex protein FliE [Bdellovibrionota bacterium]